MKEKNVIIREGWWKALKYSNREVRAECLEIVFSHIFDGIPLPATEEPLYCTIVAPWITKIKEDLEAYEQRCATNSRNRLKGWERMQEAEPQPPASGTAPDEEPAPKKPRQRFTPPTVAEVADYCKERGNGIDARQFVDYYTAKGWKVGNASMKDWKAAVRTWEQREYTNAHGNAKTAPQGVKLGVGEYINRTDGLRHYTPTRIVPMDAPPRPSTSDVWSEEKQQWVYIPD